MILDGEDGLYFPNDITAADLDEDGDVDLIVPVGFFVCEFAPRIGPCGALYWLEQTDEGWERHDVVPEGDARFFHRGVPIDFNGDGLLDIVTVGEGQIVTVGEGQEDAEAVWFRAVEAGVFEPEATVIGSGAGSLPVVHDVDGDGDHRFRAGRWRRVVDLDGDGRAEILFTSYETDQLVAFTQGGAVAT